MKVFVLGFFVTAVSILSYITDLNISVEIWESECQRSEMDFLG